MPTLSIFFHYCFMDTVSICALEKGRLLVSKRGSPDWKHDEAICLCVCMCGCTCWLHTLTWLRAVCGNCVGALKFVQWLVLHCSYLILPFFISRLSSAVQLQAVTVCVLFHQLHGSYGSSERWCRGAHVPVHVWKRACWTRVTTSIAKMETVLLHGSERGC